MKTIATLHYLTQEMEGFSHPRLAELACLGGARWVQLRVKNKPVDEWLNIAMDTKQVCRKFGARLIINDHVHIAKEICADGVHLGKTDMRPAEAKKILGDNFIIGGTANSLADMEELIKNGVDYIGLGPFRFTSTKEKLSPVLGLEGIRRVLSMVQNSPPPVIAIGGIKPEDVEPLMKAGMHGVAVSSAINFSDNKTAMAKTFCRMLEQYKINAF